MSSAIAEFPDFVVSHIGLFVFDLDAMVDFFTGTIGLHITDRGLVRETSRIVFLSRDPREHHQIVLIEGRTAPPGQQLLNQISLRVGSVEALRDALDRLEGDPRVTAIQPCNHGNAFSVYFLDPEQNRFEVFADSPFHVEQAVIEPLDLRRPLDELIAETRARHAEHPSFVPAAEWRAAFAARLGKVAEEEGRLT